MPAVPRMRVVLIVSIVAAAAMSVAVRPARAPGQVGVPAQRVFRLPRDTSPSHLALAGDGSLWMTTDLDGVVRMGPDGATRSFLDPYDDITDVARGPDGAAYAVDNGDVVRFGADGRARRYHVRGDTQPITAGAGAIWTAGSDGAPRIARVSPDGTVREFVDRAPHRLLVPVAIAVAANGTAWFTQAYTRHSVLMRGGIGRMRPDGTFANWRLPPADGIPGRIAAGSDGAMWFVEPRAIARIADDGSITRLPLPNGLRPSDIAPGSDGALWFTSNVCLGRMTTAGQVTTWQIAGAGQLRGIAPAPDGTVWLADGADAIRHVDPAAATPGSCGPPQITRQSDGTSATLTYSEWDGLNERGGGFTDLNLRITRRGQTVFGEDVPGGRAGFPAVADASSLTVRDLDGDGEAEVMVLVNDDGTQCCAWSRVYRYDRSRRSYVARDHHWGDFDAQPHVADLDRDGRPEFRSKDERLSDAFGYHSDPPIRIWSYRRGRFNDVTRHFPRLVRRDAARLWRDYRKYRGAARLILPAWTGDECRLGQAGIAFRVLERERRRGRLERSAGEYGPRDPGAFIQAVRRLLRRTGYGCAR